MSVLWTWDSKLLTNASHSNGDDSIGPSAVAPPSARAGVTYDSFIPIGKSPPVIVRVENVALGDVWTRKGLGTSRVISRLWATPYLSWSYVPGSFVRLHPTGSWLTYFPASVLASPTQHCFGYQPCAGFAETFVESLVPRVSLSPKDEVWLDPLERPWCHMRRTDALVGASTVLARLRRLTAFARRRCRGLDRALFSILHFARAALASLSWLASSTGRAVFDSEPYDCTPCPGKSCARRPVAGGANACTKVVPFQRCGTQIRRSTRLARRMPSIRCLRMGELRWHDHDGSQYRRLADVVGRRSRSAARSMGVAWSSDDRLGG
jgi:hypothetical protein